jgi:pimeloyl-ACP methyl ester carboxylesterase
MSAFHPEPTSLTIHCGHWQFGRKFLIGEAFMKSTFRLIRFHSVHTKRVLAGIGGALFLLQPFDSAVADAGGLREKAAGHTLSRLPTFQVGGNRIWARKQGSGQLTVVFEAGFGNDSSVWSGIEPRIRAKGVRTLVYDRAGMGHSSIDTHKPYSFDNDVSIFEKVLSRCGIKAPILFVGHSYGGAIGLAAAGQDKRIKGLVLLDAVVPGVWTEQEVDKNLKMMRPQYNDIRKQAPELAKVAIPWAEAMPLTARKINALKVREDLPIIEIVAEKGQSDPESARTWHAAQQAFAAGHPTRTFVLAEGSSHKIMADKPDLVVNSIETMIQKISRD